MFCPNCGKKIDDTAKYCENCGNRISEDMTSKTVISEKKTAKSKNGLFIKIAIVGVVIVGLGIAGVSLSDDKKTENTEGKVVEKNNSSQISGIQVSYTNEVEEDKHNVVEANDQEEQLYKQIWAQVDNVQERSYEDMEFSFKSDYDEQKNKVYGSLYMTQNGKESHLVTKENLDASIVTNGNTIFYANCDDNMLATVYQYDVSSQKEEILFSVETGEGLSLAGYYDEKLYYVTDLDPADFCTYDIKKKEKEKLIENAIHFTQYNQYFFLSPYCGDGGPTELTVYDASNGISCKISDKLCLVGSVEYINDEIYYLEYPSNEYQELPCDICVKKCKTDGSEQMVLLNSLKISGVLEITEDYIRYIDENGREKTRSFTSMMFTEVFESFPQVFVLTSGIGSWQTEFVNDFMSCHQTAHTNCHQIA